MSVLAVVAASTLVLTPFGPVSELIEAHNPWSGFAADGPKLLIARAERLEGESCSKWVDALLADTSESGPFQLSKDAQHKTDWGLWQPFESEDLKAIEQCDSFPCPIKFDRAETEAMTAAGKADEKLRLPKFLALVEGRVASYQSTQIRKQYEFPGDPVEPWKFFEQKGFQTTLTRPKTPSLRLRRLDFAPGKTRVVRQVLDRRAMSTSVIPKNRGKSGVAEGGVVWLRDVYTDHYFDSWGEWADVRCEGGKLVLIQALFVEFDLLKKDDLISRIARGRMRSAVEENGQKLLESWTDRLKKVAHLNAKAH